MSTVAMTTTRAIMLNKAVQGLFPTQGGWGTPNDNWRGPLQEIRVNRAQ